MLALSNFSLLKVWEFKTYDMRMAAAQKFRPKPKNVVMFYVDDTALRHMETQGINWPWPRELYASVLNFCRLGGARAVVFDLFFSEDSVYGVGDDEAFAEGVAKGPNSYFVLFLSKNETAVDPKWEKVLQKSAVPISKPFPAWVSREKSLMSLPILPLIGAAKGFGNVQIPPDEDGIYRRIGLLETLAGNAVPSIPLKIASDLGGSKKILWKQADALRIGDATVPLDFDGQMMLNYYGGADTFPSFSLANILVADAAISAGRKPDIDPSAVKDKIVVIGLAAPGLYDLKPMPLSRVFPGPEVHATAIENLLTQDFISLLRPVEIAAVTLLAGICAAVGLSLISSSWGIGMLVLSLAGLIVGSGVALFIKNIWMPIVPAFGALSLSSFIMILKNYLTEGRKKREIRRAFGQYLSPHVVTEIAKDPENLVLGGEEQKVSLFFSDIADFTSISEKTTPAKLVNELNKYFSQVTHIIQELDGTLDKYIGDAIMAFWGAPLKIPHHASQATLAAIYIQKALRKSSTFTTRIGIHTGPAVVGNIGSDMRFNYTAIGDTVNLASRLEGLNKKFGTKIIISDTTYAAAKDKIEARMIGRVRVKGREEPIGIFEPLGPMGDFGALNPKLCEAFEIAMDLYRTAKFPEALGIFSSLAARNNDPVSLYYSQACEKNIKESPQNFDGVTTFTSK